MLQRRTFWPPLLYLATAVLFFLPTFWQQRVPLPLENTYYVSDSIWSHHAPVPLAHQTNGLLGDITGYYYPYMAVAVPQLQQGHIPLWNPQIFSGMPFMATLQPAVLYPLNILFSPLGPQWIWVATAIVRLWLMGWGLHLLVRRLGARDTAAAWSGLSYQLCGSSIAWLNFPIHNVLAWLPFALYATDRLLAQPRSRWFMLLVACLAIQFLGGHPETSALFVIVWGSWTLVHLPWRRPVERLALLVLAGVAAIGLTLPQLLPAMALIRDSGTLVHRLQSASYLGAWSNLKHFLLVLNPYLYGTPLNNRYWGPANSYLESAVYMGTLTVPFAVVGVIAARPRRTVMYWATVAFLSLGWCFPLPGLAALYRLPLFQVGVGIRFTLSWSLAAAVLAGLGVEALLSQRPWSRGVFVGTAMACVVGLVGSVLTLRSVSVGTSSWLLNRQPRLETLLEIAALYKRSDLQFVMLLVMALVGVGLAWLVVVQPLRRWVPVLLLPVLYLDLTAYGMPFNGSVAPAAIYPPTPLMTQLHTTPGFFRIDTLSVRIMENNVSMTQGLDNVLGYEDVVGLRYARFVNRRRKISGLNHNTLLAIQPPAQRFFNLANVQFLLSTVPISTTGPWSLWQHDGRVGVYRNSAVLPRAFAVGAVYLTTPDTAIDAVYAPSFDPRRAAVVEERIPNLPTLATGQSAAPLSARTIITSYAAEDVVLTVDVDRPALVVLSDSYADGWQVTVDQQPARLYRTNAVYRGVPVSAGHHVISYRYLPRDVQWGALGTGLALLMCAGVCWWLRTDKLGSLERD